MALTHHYIANYIAGIPQEDYSLVGDDLLIRNNPEGYAKYIAFMETIGMTINPQKQVISSRENLALEFAQNFVVNGSQILPIQYGVLFA